MLDLVALYVLTLTALNPSKLTALDTSALTALNPSKLKALNTFTLTALLAQLPQACCAAKQSAQPP